MEKFVNLTTSIICNQSSISMAFKDDATFQKAKQIWDWANGEANRSFIIVAGAQQCGWNQHRQPFVISSLEFDETTNKAKLNGITKSWKDVAHSYDLKVGQVVAANQTALQRSKRDYTKDVSIPFDLDLPFSVSLSEGDYSTSLTCVTCGTSGHFNIELIISTWLGLPTGASVKVSPSGVRVDAKLQWSLAGKLTSSKKKEWTPLSFPTPATIEIPEVVTIGPTIDLVVGIALNSLQAKAVVTGGAYATIPDTAYAEVNLLNPTDFRHSSWMPSIGTYPFEVDAEIQAQVEAYLAPTLALKAEALGYGYEVELQLRLIDLTGTFVYEVSTSGVCDSTKTQGVSANLAIGAKLVIDAKPVDSSSDDLSFTLGTSNFPLAELCFPFGPSSPSPTSIAASNPISKSRPSPNPSDSSNSCALKFGASATCIPTSSCSTKGSGWTHTAGYCPGGTDIQCCHQSPDTASSAPAPSSTSPVTCIVNSGVSGTCISTSACSAKGGYYSEPGHCPGGTDIQCCHKPPTCTGMIGVCILTSACVVKEGNSTPNHCPGPSDVQCCSHITSSTPIIRPITSTVSKSSSSASSTADPNVICGNGTSAHVYTPVQVRAAQDEGCRHLRANTTLGPQHYPHQYKNMEGFTTFRTNFPWYEFPMLIEGAVYTGGSPGPDRVVFDFKGGMCDYSGSITHTGAPNLNGFVGCSDTLGP